MATVASLVAGLGWLALGGRIGSESAPTSSRPERWSSEQAWEWYDRRPWLCGFNYVPSTAVNTTEFWQAETFDAPTIDRELGWASEVGFNTSRVFIQYLVWKHDAEGLKRRLDRFLTIAKRHGMSVMPVLFDDCAFSGKEPYLGKQADPVPGIHNSQWTASPGLKRVTDRSVWPDLERYVKDLVGGFRDDPRVILWDLYNEPGNSGMGNKSLPLLQASFGWARSAGPRQPVTVGIWDDKLVDLNRCCIEESDAISFHRYGPIASVQDIIGRLTAHGRPIICTEWMSRVLGSRWETDLPVLKQARIGCYCWGLVNGKTQTHYPWGSPKGAPEPKDWHHDLFRKDGKPYRPAEIEAIRKILRGEG